MKNYIKTLLFLGLILSLSSFTESGTSNFVGTYGVSENNPAGIELVLNEDNTFTYKDFSNKAKPIDVGGKWELKNNKILLKNTSTNISFHNKWRITKDGKFAKSRKGLAYYSLLKLQ